MSFFVAPLADQDREVRLAAADGLCKIDYREARSTLREAVTDARLKTADLTEKRALIDAYAVLARGEAVDLLDRFLNGRGILRRGEPAEIRACAAHALGLLRTADAMRVLKKAATHGDPLVRHAVERAMRAER